MQVLWFNTSNQTRRFPIRYHCSRSHQKICNQALCSPQTSQYWVLLHYLNISRYPYIPVPIYTRYTLLLFSVFVAVSKQEEQVVLFHHFQMIGPKALQMLMEFVHLKYNGSVRYKSILKTSNKTDSIKKQQQLTREPNRTVKLRLYLFHMVVKQV